MTAHVLEEEKQRCEAAGMNGFIPKPFKQADILNALAGVGEDFIISNETTPKDPISTLGMSNLTELAEGDISFAIKLLDSFIKTSSLELIELEKANQENDLEKIKYLTHKLRSSFILFEFENLIELSLELEARPETGSKLSNFIQQLQEKIDFIKKSKDLLER